MGDQDTYGEPGRSNPPGYCAGSESKMAEKKLVKEQIIGLGMGLPAPVNEDGIVQNTANLGWGYKEVTRELEELLDGMKVIPGNDANVAALGEMWKGGGKGHKNVIMVNPWNRCWRWNHRGWKVPCRGTRCWRRDRSSVCKLPGDRNLWMWKERLSGTVCFCNRNHKTCNMRLAKDEKPSTLRNVAEMSAKEVFDAVKAGDEVAIENRN